MAYYDSVFLAFLLCIHSAASSCPCQLEVVVTYSPDDGTPIDQASIANDVPTLITGFETLVISEDTTPTTVHTVHTAHTQHAMGMGMGMGSVHVPTVHAPSAHTQHTAHAPMVGTVHAAMTSHASMSLSMGMGPKAGKKAVVQYVTTIYLSAILPSCGAGDVQAFTDAATAAIQSYFDQQGIVISVIADAATTTSTCAEVLSAIAGACYFPVPVGSALVAACHDVNEALLCNLAETPDKAVAGRKEDVCAADFSAIQTQLDFVSLNCYFDEVDTNTDPVLDFSDLIWSFADLGVLANGHNGVYRTYDSNTMPAGSPFSFIDKSTLRWSIENSANCGGPNPFTQVALAQTSFIVTAVGPNPTLTFAFDGIGEKVNANYELAEFRLNGVLLGQGHAPGGLLSGENVCTMGPLVGAGSTSVPLTLGPHTFLMSFTTNDALYHVGAYYEINVVLNDVTVVPDTSKEPIQMSDIQFPTPPARES